MVQCHGKSEFSFTCTICVICCSDNKYLKYFTFSILFENFYLRAINVLPYRKLVLNELSRALSHLNIAFP